MEGPSQDAMSVLSEADNSTDFGEITGEGGRQLPNKPSSQYCN